MIRQPSTYRQLYAWWMDAVQNGVQSMIEDQPHCGFYQMRQVKNGPWVPVELFIQRFIDVETGELTEPERVMCKIGADGPVFAAEKVWTQLRPISEQRYSQLMADHEHHPTFRATHAPVDLSTTPMRP